MPEPAEAMASDVLEATSIFAALPEAARNELAAGARVDEVAAGEDAVYQREARGRPVPHGDRDRPIQQNHWRRLDRRQRVVQ